VYYNSKQKKQNKKTQLKPTEES